MLGHPSLRRDLFLLWRSKYFDLSKFVQVDWPIDEETFYNAERQDKIAKDMYRGLLLKWLNNTQKDTVHPRSSCLAIARDVFCTHSFRRCKNFLNTKQPLCQFMCDLFKLRCNENDDEPELFELICNQTS